MVLAAVVNSGWQPHGPAGQAMIVDMMHSTRLGSCLPVMQVVSQLGPWLGNIMLVIVVALGLTDYTPVWGSLTVPSPANRSVTNRPRIRGKLRHDILYSLTE